MSTTTIFLTTATTSTTNSFTYIKNTTANIPESDIEKSCAEYYANSTGIFIKDYEGIPENLLINVCVWFGLLILFTFIRKIGDYGRFGLLKNDEERYVLIIIFYVYYVF